VRQTIGKIWPLKDAQMALLVQPFSSFSRRVRKPQRLLKCWGCAHHLSAITKRYLEKETGKKFLEAIERGSLKKPSTKQRHMTAEQLGRHWTGRVATQAFRRAMKRKLIAEGRPWRCEGCGLTKWRGQSIILELHHKHGDPKRNMPEDFELLCLNCHSMTESYRGKNTRAARAKGCIYV
jgi:hypothetical protein